MSSARSSNSPAAMEEEPRKKGARGGKRSVTHLSKAQLARKRANDREAQRNIRQRTKEHIENLEKKVKELEGNNRSSSMERVLKRNKELEQELEILRGQVATHSASHPASSGASISSDIPDGLPLEWIPEQQASNGGWPGVHMQQPMEPHEIPVTNGSYTTTSQVYPPATQSMTFEESQTEGSQKIYPPTLPPVWDEPMVFRNSSHAIAQPTPAWAPFHPACKQPSRFADLQPSGFTDLLNQESYEDSTVTWQTQPSVYAWQNSTKHKAPVTLVDQLMFGVIHSQRHLAHPDISREGIINENFPSVHQLFNQPSPVTPLSDVNETMSQYASVISTRGFALIPEKLASFMCMYRFIQWQISPTNQNFHKLHHWQSPCPAQLLIPHPAWMDLPPWSKFREMVIENQAKYDNEIFQNDYTSNLSINFPHNPLEAVFFEDDQIRVSSLMESHLSDLENMSMKKPFADKYPEFRNVCRFEEI